MLATQNFPQVTDYEKSLKCEQVGVTNLGSKIYRRSNLAGAYDTYFTALNGTRITVNNLSPMKIQRRF